jgi:hypothetical protein
MGSPTDAITQKNTTLCPLRFTRKFHEAWITAEESTSARAAVVMEDYCDTQCHPEQH